MCTFMPSHTGIIFCLQLQFDQSEMNVTICHHLSKLLKNWVWDFGTLVKGKGGGEEKKTLTILEPSCQM